MNPQDSGYFSPSPPAREIRSRPMQMGKPQDSYVALIARAILSSPNCQMLLVDIYDWIVTEYPYYGTLQSKAWRNSIRHNLSLNECFVRKHKAENGRGYYWGIHQAAFDGFSRGDFRRRQARLRAKRADNSSTQQPQHQNVTWMNTEVSLDYSTMVAMHQPHPYVYACPDGYMHS